MQQGLTKFHQLRKPKPQVLKMNGDNASEPVYPEPDVEAYAQGTERDLREVR